MPEENTALIIESAHGSYVSPVGYLNDDPSFGSWDSYTISTIEDRKGGKEAGLFENETELASIRGQCHRLYDLAQPAKTAVEILTNYTFGAGIEIKAKPAKGFDADPEAVRLAARCQRIIEAFEDDNDWQVEAEAEINRRVRRDGEVFIVLSWAADGIALRFVEPEMICAPLNPQVCREEMFEESPELRDVPYSYTFGVITPENDVVNVVGYNVRWTNSPADEEFIPVWRMVHIKSRDTDRNVKRAVPEFEVIRRDLMREAKIKGNTAEGAALQAAIAYIVQHPQGTGRNVAQAQIDEVAGGKTTKGVIGGGVREKAVASSNGTKIVHIPQGKEFLPGPMGSERCGDFLAVGQYLLRACAARWCIPEFMLTSDASNASYSSTLVAESPFVAAREHDQRWFVRQFRKLFWKVLRMALATPSMRARHESWERLQALVEIELTPPQVHTTDRLQQHTILQGQKQEGVISVRTWREMVELDHDIEERNLAEERAKAPQPPAQEGNPFAGLFGQQAAESLLEDCGTGDGGFKAGNRCGKEAGGGGGGKAKGGKSVAPKSAAEKKPSKAKSRDALVSATRDKDGKLTMSDGSAIPDHIAKLTIPPAWKNVEINPNSGGSLLVKGTDAKGRRQSVYSESHAIRQAEKKFTRTRELIKKRDAIFAQNLGNLSHEDPKVREAAGAMAVIHATGLRPGSDRDTKAEKRAYGATNLQGSHVVVKDGDVRLQFTGKKGVALDIPVTDKQVAKLLIDRKKQAGESGRLFNTSDAELRDYSKTLNGGSFKPKDFRTLKGTTTAIEQIKSLPAPKNEKEFKRQVKQVAKVVSDKLGNTPTVALQSYIDPSVFSAWRAA